MAYPAKIEPGSPAECEAHGATEPDADFSLTSASSSVLDPVYPDKVAVSNSMVVAGIRSLRYKDLWRSNSGVSIDRINSQVIVSADPELVSKAVLLSKHPRRSFPHK